MNFKGSRGVAPVIATLLLVGISVVGGTIVFVVSQDAFTNFQVTGANKVEFIAFKGYDATEGLMLFHNGLEGNPKGNEGDGLLEGERIGVYVQNNSVEKITISKVRLAGTDYSFVPNSGPVLDAWTPVTTDGILGTPADPSYVIMTRSDTILDSEIPVIESGQQVSIVFELDRNFNSQRDLQFFLETTKRNTVIGTVITGEKTTAVASVTGGVGAGPGGGCLIATATYGSELAPQVQKLRELRDDRLIQTKSGSSFMNGFNEFYYSVSPAVADYERENPAFKELVKISLVPLLASLSILNNVELDSEAKVLGYGIGVISLNIGMYFIVPGLIIFYGVRKSQTFFPIKN